MENDSMVFATNENEDTFNYQALFEYIIKSTYNRVKDPLQLSKYYGIIKNINHRRKGQCLAIDYEHYFHDMEHEIIEYLKRKFPDTHPEISYEEALEKFRHSSFADHIISAMKPIYHKPFHNPAESVIAGWIFDSKNIPYPNIVFDKDECRKQIIQSFEFNNIESVVKMNTIKSLIQEEWI